ncbi:MAG: Flp1 family type IVb pilin [Eubacterium sp.]|nr:Flp1 family type IVb pilin [Eubacterium sp.]
MKKIQDVRAEVREYMTCDDAIGVVEIILILVVLIALVLLFKNQIVKVVSNAFKSFNSDSTEIIG